MNGNNLKFAAAIQRLLWRWVCLRGAGFPAKHVLNLAARNRSTACDELLVAEDQFESARDSLKSRFSKLQTLSPEAKSAVRKVLKLLKKSKVPSGTNDEFMGEATDALSAAKFRLDAARTNFDQVFEADSVRIAKIVCDFARTERFQEAIIWQNRRALHTGIKPLLRRQQNDARSSKIRQHEELVARYLQRYCTKNDTVGFFGPVGWALLEQDGRAISIKPGPELLASREVFIEVWCIDAVAEALAQDEAILPWVPPRRMHHVHLEGRTAHIPMRKAVILSTQEATVLEACDGVRAAKRIALDLIRAQCPWVKGEADVYGLLRRLREQGLVSWSLEVPIGPYPERYLRRTLERIDDRNVFNHCMSALNEIERSRDDIVKAGSNATELDRAVEKLESVFTKLTGAAATQNQGETYAGRTLMYEDCRRDVEVKFGPEFLQSLGPPLSLLLTAVRWLTYQLSVRCDEAFREVYSEMARKSGAKTLPFLSFWYLIYPMLWKEQDEMSSRIEAQFQKKWQSILSLPDNHNQAEYTTVQLQSSVAKAFSVPNSGWRSVLYSSPDVMIAASGPDAIERGDYKFVLGELHVGINTLDSQLFVLQHPSPEELYRAAELDQGQRIVPIIPKIYRGKTSRSLPMLISPADYRLELAAEPSNAPSSHVVPIGSLLIEEDGGSLRVRTRDGKLRFGIEDILYSAAVRKVTNSFKILAPGPHNPRITVDKLIVTRESWSFNPERLEFAGEKQPSARFLSVKRWARKEGLPRFVFVKTPSEVKPFFLDLDNPYCVNTFLKAVRQTREKNLNKHPVTLTEMVPSLEELWLPDAEGQRYTSELRLVALELPRSAARNRERPTLARG